MTDKNSEGSIKGNETEEFLKRIIIKIIASTIILIVGVGVAAYYMGAL